MEYKQIAKPLSKNWKVEKKHETSYSGGHVEYVQSIDSLACLRNGNVAFLSLQTGEVTSVLVEEETPESAEEIVCFVVNPNGEEIITASRNQLIRVWNLTAKTMTKTWKAHDSPIASMAYDSTGTLLLTGSADHTAKVWDISKGYCTHNFRHSFGVVNLVTFTQTNNPLYAITCCDDLIIRIWNLYESKNNQLIAELKGHLNTVTNLCMCDNGILLSASRDKTVMLWDVLTGQLLKTSVIYESIESVQQIPISMYPAFNIVPAVQTDKKSKKQTKIASTEFYVLLSGDKGVIYTYRIRSTLDGSSISYSFDQITMSSGDNELIFHKKEMENTTGRNNAYYASLFVLKSLMICVNTSTIIGVTNSDNFKIYSITAGNITYSHTVIGNNDEIVDLCYVGDNNHLAVATNSYELRLLTISTFSSHLLYGHKDTILSIKASPNGAYLLTTSKDRTVKLWHVGTLMCLATCEGHFQDVSCCAISQKRRVVPRSLITMIIRDAMQSDCNHDGTVNESTITSLCESDEIQTMPSFWISGSEDKTIKLWDLSSVSNSTINGAKVTVKAHDKSINAVCIAPNDRLAASGSMDRTIKLWELPSMSCVRTLVGHKKGVWDISFSTISSVLLSSSGDQTIRVWNVTDGSTLYTIEGFDHSLLRTAFISNNMQILSCDNAGIVKINNITNKECVCTIDAHDDKIWALAVPQDKDNSVDTFVTGSADGQIKVWRDCTKETEEEELQNKEELFMREQEFQKSLLNGDYKKALKLALELDKPYNFRLIVEKIIKLESSTYETTLKELLGNLGIDEISKLFSYIREWNLIGRTFVAAQVVLHILMGTYSFDVLKKIKNMNEIVDTLIAYNKRHLERTDRLIQNSYLVDYILQNMNVLQSNVTDLKRDGDVITDENVKRSKLE